MLLHICTGMYVQLAALPPLLPDALGDGLKRRRRWSSARAIALATTVGATFGLLMFATVLIAVRVACRTHRGGIAPAIVEEAGELGAQAISRVLTLMRAGDPNVIAVLASVDDREAQRERLQRVDSMSGRGSDSASVACSLPPLRSVAKTFDPWALDGSHQSF